MSSVLYRAYVQDSFAYSPINSFPNESLHKGYCATSFAPYLYQICPKCLTYNAVVMLQPVLPYIPINFVLNVKCTIWILSYSTFVDIAIKSVPTQLHKRDYLYKLLLCLTQIRLGRPRGLWLCQAPSLLHKCI